MSYFGDIRLGDTIDIKFTTRRFSTGAPFTLAGTPVVSAYPGNSTTQLTAGITLTVDFDTVTGLNNVRVVATGGNGYATATNYSLVITTGTVDSVSVVGEVIGNFSIENRSGVMPTTAGRTLTIESDGMAHADVKEWLGVGSRGEPGQGAPPVNTDPMTKIDYLYKSWRNKKDNNGTDNRFYADDGTTVDHKQSTSSSGGTVTKGEIISGA